ncbi:hypothetical protein B0H13DRAFT_2369898 [Mycena leptocephala]|nr:hypothetical protein B0H13DRAFT_2369898 [Mycena leptocephala]
MPSLLIWFLPSHLALPLPRSVPSILCALTQPAYANDLHFADLMHSPRSPLRARQRRPAPTLLNNSCYSFGRAAAPRRALRTIWSSLHSSVRVLVLGRMKTFSHQRR